MNIFRIQKTKYKAKALTDSTTNTFYTLTQEPPVYKTYAYQPTSQTYPFATFDFVLDQSVEMTYDIIYDDNGLIEDIIGK